MSGFSAVTINLASQPFRRERAQNAVLAAVCAMLICSLLVFVSLMLRERTQVKGIRRTISAKSATLHRLQGEQARFSRILAEPQNADVFSRSVFLNELVARKSVSWTRVFADLGTVMPNNMRLLGIRLPQVAAEEGTGTNRVQLDMVVGTDQPSAVIELLKRLQKSSLFGAASVMTQTPPSQNDPSYKYRVTVAYAQKL